MPVALGKVLADLHGNVVFPGHPDLPDVPRRGLDDEWLARSLVRRVWWRSPATSASATGPWNGRCGSAIGCAGFVLTGTASQSTSDSLALLQRHWPEMTVIVGAEPVGPWMYAVTQAGVRQIRLTTPDRFSSPGTPWAGPCASRSDSILVGGHGRLLGRTRIRGWPRRTYPACRPVRHIEGATGAPGRRILDAR